MTVKSISVSDFSTSVRGKATPVVTSCHVRMLLPPPLGKVALVALLSPEWGCEGASSMEQQTALNAAWVAEADAVLLEHYASFFDSPR